MGLTLVHLAFLFVLKLVLDSWPVPYYFAILIMDTNDSICCMRLSGPQICMYDCTYYSNFAFTIIPPDTRLYVISTDIINTDIHRGGSRISESRGGGGPGNC